MEEKEIWKTIDGFSGDYKISKAYNLPYNVKLLKQFRIDNKK